MQIQLSDHFSYGKLIRFTLPSILMMIFTSIYSVVDGFFISNYVGKTAFASVNLIIPYLQILGGMGAMLGVGGSALTAKTLGGRRYSPGAAVFHHDDLSDGGRGRVFLGNWHCVSAAHGLCIRRQ